MYIFEENKNMQVQPMNFHYVNVEIIGKCGDAKKKKYESGEEKKNIYIYLYKPSY